MDYLTGAISWLFWTLIAIVMWVLSYVFWIVVWLILPLAIAAFVAVRVAEKVFGGTVVRAWVKTQSMKFGAGAWVRARRLLFALGVLPVRVLLWFVVYAVWHSLVSLLWRPKWQPWQRAWDKRWKAPQTTPSGRRMAKA